MSKYITSNTIDQEGQGVLLHRYNKNLFDISTFGSHDNTPDVDGIIRLKDGRGNYLNNFLLFQLKSTNRVINNKYPCDKKTFDFLQDVSCPTILIVVDVTTERVFWHHFDTKKVKKRKQTVDLSNNEICTDGQEEVHQRFLAISNKLDYGEAKGLLKEISAEFDVGVSNFIGLLFLLQKIDKTNAEKVFQKILGLSSDEIKVIVNKLTERKLILETRTCYLLENEQVGREAAMVLLDGIKIDEIFNVIKSKEERDLILQQISNEVHQEIGRFLDLLAKENLCLFKTEEKNDIISINLELLENYAFRVPDISLKVIRHLVREKKVKQCEKYDKISIDYDLFSTTSNAGVILECIKVLKGLRYFRTRAVLKILLSLCESVNINIREASANVIKDIASYNPSVLQAIAYEPQTVLLDEIDKLGANRQRRLFILLCGICDNLLEPSFRGSSMKDYQTFVISFGALLPLTELEDVRARGITLLKELYDRVGDFNARKLVLTTLSKATQTPHRGEVKAKLIQIIELNCEADSTPKCN